jgi:hypothetical protein
MLRELFRFVFLTPDRRHRRQRLSPVTARHGLPGAVGRLRVELLESRRLLSVSPTLLNSWFVSGQGEYAQVISAVSGGTTTGPGTTWSGQNSPVLGDVQKVQYSTGGNSVYVSTPDLASYTMGPWWMDATHTQPFVNFPKDQATVYRVSLNTTYPSATHLNTGNGPVGLAVNGVVFFNNGDAFSYRHASAADVAMSGDGVFNRMAEWAESATFDEGNGHQPGNGQYHYHTDPPALRAQLGDNIDYVGDTNFFPYDPMAYYLTHGEGADGTYAPHTTDLHHSPIIGWMFDGYPIYGPYGYTDPTDPTSPVVRMTSSFALRTDLTTGSPRVTVPGWSAQADAAVLGAAAAATAADALYTMTAAQQASYAGPAVSATYPLGRYGEDYAYVPGSGTLDQFGGRWCVTPEFPNGTYAYFDVIDAAGAPAFPYSLGRQYYGSSLNGNGKVTSITEPVATSFDVSVNTAPVVSGPASASVGQGGTLAFTGGNRITVSDVDAAATESVTLTASSGTVAVDRTSVMAGLTTITGGANSRATFTLNGPVSALNAALATLTYTAPATGSSATLTVRANDGSASNNLSNTLTTEITLTSSNSAPVTSGPTTASVSHNGTLAFTGAGNVFSVADPDSPAETVNLVATTGTLTVTTGGALVTGIGTGSMTVSGSLPNVNAALATIAYTAPGTGTSATLTVQADDGSPTNHAGNTLTTTITLTNLAPVMTGPASESVQLGAVLAFTGAGSIFAVTDPDSPATTVTLGVTSGTLSVSAGGGTTITGNGTGAVTVAGPLAGVNATLATLMYTAPGTGAAATLTARADDGGPSNNLSNTLTTAVALTAVPPPPAPPPTPPPPAPRGPVPNLVGFPPFAAGSDAGRPSAAFVYHPDGSLSASFNPFPGTTGGVRTAVGDFNADGTPDVAFGTGPGAVAEVTVMDGKTGALLLDILPFADFTGGVFLAAGDITGDGKSDLVVTPDLSGGPRVEVYSGGDFQQVANFYGIDDPDFRGGARAAVGDLNGDGFADLVVSAGFGGGPRISVYDGAALSHAELSHPVADFFLFEDTLRNGAYVAVGDVSGDGFADVIGGGGPGGGPRVLVLSGRALLSTGPTAAFAAPVANFFAGDVDNRGGVRVSAKDLDGDTRADIVVGDGSGAGTRVTAYAGRDLVGGDDIADFAFDAYPGFNGGVYVG